MDMLKLPNIIVQNNLFARYPNAFENTFLILLLTNKTKQKKKLRGP
jgi:hypothetical protein